MGVTKLFIGATYTLVTLYIGSGETREERYL